MNRTSTAVVLILAAVVAYTEGCDLYAFERCLTEFTDKYPDASDSFAPSYSKQQLVDVCRDFSVAADCAEPTIRGCGQDVRALWAVLDNVMNYMCTDRTKVILRNYSSCVEGQPLQNDIVACNRTMQGVTTKIQRYGGTRSELCSAMKNFARCSVGSADRHCGPVVASWYGGLIDAALDPSKDVIDCYFTAGASSVAMNCLTLLAVLLLSVLAA